MHRCKGVFQHHTLSYSSAGLNLNVENILIVYKTVALERMHVKSAGCFDDVSRFSQGTFQTRSNVVKITNNIIFTLFWHLINDSMENKEKNLWNFWVNWNVYFYICNTFYRIWLSISNVSHSVDNNLDLKQQKESHRKCLCVCECFE